MRKCFLIRQNGFMLTELIVVLALLGLVLSLGYMFFNFGIRTFAQGERQAIAQGSIRRGADIITNNLRYANKLIINPSTKSDEGFYYIYLDGDSVIFSYNAITNEDSFDRVILDGIADDIPYRIYFEESSEVDNYSNNLLINFTLEAENLYTISTNVVILNIHSTGEYEDNSIEGSKTTEIKFSKPN